MKQTGHIQRIIEAVALDDCMPKGKFTPSDDKPLVKDENSEPASRMFSYGSVVGMLLYISGHTRPDVSLAINSFSQYIFIPKRSNELSVKILAH